MFCLRSLFGITVLWETHESKKTSRKERKLDNKLHNKMAAQCCAQPKPIELTENVAIRLCCILSRVPDVDGFVSRNISKSKIKTPKVYICVCIQKQNQKLGQRLEIFINWLAQEAKVVPLGAMLVSQKASPIWMSLISTEVGHLMIFSLVWQSWSVFAAN